MTAPPDGFVPHTRTSPATAGWEPIYARILPDAFRLGLRIAAGHCNSRGLLHGGVIATLADNACGLSLGVVLGGSPVGIVTTHLAVDYIGMAKLGQWLEVAPRVVKAGKSSGVVDALITADGEVIARANASFRVLA
jgi:uncharacterized protein (TIGR00369 family)